VWKFGISFTAFLLLAFHSDLNISRKLKRLSIIRLVISIKISAASKNLILDKCDRNCSRKKGYVENDNGAAAGYLTTDINAKNAVGEVLPKGSQFNRLPFQGFRLLHYKKLRSINIIKAFAKNNFLNRSAFASA